jgi:hypothetical protein
MPGLLKRQLTKDDCVKWKENKKKHPKSPKNPITNYKVSPDSKIYHEINTKCEDFSISSSPVNEPHREQQITTDICEEWIANKRQNPNNPKNPLSKYKISKTSAIYKNLDKKCAELGIIMTPKPVSPKAASPKAVSPKAVSPKAVSPKAASPKAASPKVLKNPKTNILSRPLNLQDCLFWSQNKTKNPISKYTLSDKSNILKEIHRQCEPILAEHNKKAKQDSPILNSAPINIPQPIFQPVSNKQLKSLVSIDDLYYPSLDDKYFREKLVNLNEYQLYQVPVYPNIKSKKDFEDISKKLCGEFEKTLYQYFVSHYISARTPYKSILLYHAVGVGKTCSAITLAEGFLTSHATYNEAKIWVVMPKALKQSFKEQIFSLANFENFEYLANQCTGELYMDLLHLMKENDKAKITTKLKKLIQSRYKLFTYEAFATFIDTEYTQKNKTVKDKVIIIDEAHNIRSMNDEKRVYTTLTNVLQQGLNNRLVLLSATPMYNTPEDIYDLLYLLLLNDKRTDILQQYPFPACFTNGIRNQTAIQMIEHLATNYISYLKGKNPFTFALKLSPKYMSSIPFLTHEFEYDSNDKKIPEMYKGWLKHVDEGIVISQLGSKQQEYITEHESGDENNVFNNLQPMNIVYDNTVGEKGFNTFFTRTDNTNALQVRYNKKYTNALMPEQEYLGKYSGKFLNICNILKNTQGITVIYSGYIWSGIIPLAVCLEHMGFQREGANNILHNPQIIEDAPKYAGIKHPKYCIMTSDNNDVMGSTSIDNLLKIINSPKNIDGSQVKVILITPVAGEGLSFYNVREMHLVEPWFHFNRVTQIIGRGIRNCRHQDLPLEERNTTVFMHASNNTSLDNSHKESTDIHAFRIAAHKQIQSNVIEKVIRDHAVDCSLMKNINYFPKSLFELGNINIKTSQNTVIQHAYGDEKNEEPMCGIEFVQDSNKDISELRKESYKHFTVAIQNKIRRIVLQSIHTGERYVSFDNIYDYVNFNKQITHTAIQQSVYPNILIDGYILIPHEDGLHIINVQPEKITKIRITYEEPVVKKSEQSSKKCNYAKLDALMKKNNYYATVALYMWLQPQCFEELVKTFIESAELSEVDTFIANILYTQGALIGKHEIRLKTETKKYIGYVNIFDDKKFEAIVYTGDRYRDLTEREENELIANRTRQSKPLDMSQEQVAWGMIVPILDKKKSTYTNVFKLLTAGASKSAKTGIVCTSLQKPVHDTIMQQMGVQNMSDTKDNNCVYIAEELLKMNRMTLIPEYKPK